MLSDQLQEILDHLQIRKVDVEEYLGIDYSEPVYCQIDVLDYNKRIDGQPGDMKEFF